MRRADQEVGVYPWVSVPAGVLAAAAPWRVFRWYQGQQHYSGTYWSCTQRDHVIHESRLELAVLLLADFDRSVRGILAQPFLVRAEVGGASRRHIPDYLLLTGSGPVVVDVKPRRRLARPEVAATFGWTRTLVEERGWRYEVRCEPPPERLENVRFLAGYRREWLFDPGLLARLRAAGLEGASLGEACRWPGPLARGGAAPAVVRALHHRSGPAAEPLTPAAGLAVSAGVRVGVGTRFSYDGEIIEVVQVTGTAAGMEVIAADSRGRVTRLGLRELLVSGRARVIPDGPGPAGADDGAAAGVLLSQLSQAQREQARERAGHVREVLTGYRSGSAELPADGEPRAEYDPALPLEDRYAAKATELGAGVRTVKRWVSRFRQLGEAGLAPLSGAGGDGPLGRVDERWADEAGQRPHHRRGWEG